MVKKDIKWNFKTEKSEDGLLNLSVNGINIYSRYNPLIEATKFIQSEVKLGYNQFNLFGLGLGYHLKALSEWVTDCNAKIYVYIFHKSELTYYKNMFFFNELNQDKRITFISNDESYDIEGQIIIANAWLKAITREHPLFFFLNDIKTKQHSYKIFQKKIEENFRYNTARKEFELMKYRENLNICRTACLISSGPSLSETYHYLNNTKDRLYILCVGSALIPLLYFGIMPDAVIISDPLDETKQQLDGVAYDGPVFYLSTASKMAVEQLEKNKKYLLLQSGYTPAEDLASEIHYPLLETGGSVATTAFSLLEYLGFESIIFFGQDLGFNGNKTHVEGSTSRIREENPNLYKVESNDGKFINTYFNLLSYRSWFEKKIKETDVTVYNTALNGAKINGVPYISEKEFSAFIKKR